MNPPTGIWDQQPESLTWIPGTHSLWGTATGLAGKGSYGVIIKYGPKSKPDKPSNRPIERTWMTHGPKTCSR